MSRPREEKARVIALAGGKGGVGTTLLSANLAIHLARQGREVVLLDAATGGPAAHAHVGLPFPEAHLGRRIEKNSPGLAELLVTGGIPSLKLLAGLPDRPSMPPRPDGLMGAVLRETAGLSCDFVVADVGSGRSAAVRQACLAADLVLLVSTPEPESLRATLRLQAGILFGALQEALGAERASGLERRFAARGLRSILESLKEDEEGYREVVSAARARGFGLLLNQVRTSADVQAATRLGAVLSMVQAIVVDPVHTLEYDLSVLQAAGEQRVLSQRYPNAPVSRSLERLAYGLISPPSPPRFRGGDRYAPVSTWHHYRLLALDPKATPREVQRHYEWIRAPFQAGGEAEAVASREHLDGILARVEAAYRTLIFLENRREYDRQLVASGILEASDLRMLEGDEAQGPAVDPEGGQEGTAVEDGETAPQPAASKDPPATEPGAEADGARSQEPLAPSGPAPGRPYSGAVLRDLRQRRRLDRERIAEITKIRVHQIEAIEDDRYPDLPVPVFLRGFLKAYARCLELDPEEVAGDYLSSYESWRSMQP